MPFPPLRRRIDDLKILTGHILGRVTVQLGFRNIEISDKAFKVLGSFDWPGNVRELENYLERACILCESDLLLPEHLPQRLHMRDRKQAQASIKTLQQGERDLILSALSESQGNISRAAQSLGISRSTIHRRLRAFNIEPPPTT